MSEEKEKLSDPKAGPSREELEKSSAQEAADRIELAGSLPI